MTLRALTTSSRTGPKPSRTLGRHGANLWRSITHEYAIADSAGIELLTLACQSLDRAESMRDQIDRDGLVIRSRDSAIKDHPCLRHELQARQFVVRTLEKLGITYEAVKSVGRPPAGIGWRGPDAD